MGKYVSWIYFELRWHEFERYLKKKQRNKASDVKKYACKSTLSTKDSNQLIYDAIINKRPFLAARLGGSEMKVIAYIYRYRLFPFRTDARADYIRDMCTLSGFFPNELEYGEKFAEMMTNFADDLDLNGIWATYMEEWFLYTYAKKTELTWIHNLEPWNVQITDEYDVRWTYALEGKKVLVIHPFADTIALQYSNHRKELFKNLDEKLLPEFQLITLKAVQSLGGQSQEFETWFDAYEYMLGECKKIDFDVAIIGCGAYGLPLGAEIKKMGKVAIHLGGTVQLLFGIRGKRWDSYGGVYETMINDSWTRASEEEITPIMKKVEGGCYL